MTLNFSEVLFEEHPVMGRSKSDGEAVAAASKAAREKESSDDSRPEMKRAESAEALAVRKIEQYESASKLRRPERRGSVEQLTWDDVELGRLIDKGSFSCVYEATLSRDRVDPAPLYAVKCLRENVVEHEDTFVTGAVDLAVEASILSKLMHPNIIRLHGASGGCISESFRDERGFFLVLDLLADTLDRRLKRWRRDQSMSSFSFRSKHDKQRLREGIQDVALGVAEGLAYIHSRHIIFRDLKPQNIGFDEANNRVMIFDFGLAREADSLGNLRQMTGNAGTPRYMAPELARDEKYGFPSDVYSFSILLWEIVTLEKPYDHIKSLPQFNEEVVRRHVRPSLKRMYPPELKTLLEQSWDKDQEKRPTFEEICQSLRTYLSESEQKSQGILRHLSTLSSQRSSINGEDSTARAHDSADKRQDSGCETQATSNTCTNSSSDQGSERQARRRNRFLFWRRKPSENPEAPIVDRTYQERTWIQRNFLRKATMRLDLSTRSFRVRQYDLGRPGSFRSSDSFRTNEGGASRRPSMNSNGSGEFSQRRRSSGKSDKNIEAMAATLAAEAKSNREFLREMKRKK